MIVNPYPIQNDGLLDLAWISDPRVNNLFGIAGALDNAKNGGLQVYNNTMTFMRGKKLRISIKGRQSKKPFAEGTEHLAAIDGEDFFFKNYL